MARLTYLKLLLVLAAAIFIFPSVLAATFNPLDITFHTGETKIVNLTGYLTLETNETLLGYYIPSTTHIHISSPVNGNVTFSVQPEYADWIGYEQVTAIATTNLTGVVTNNTQTMDVLVTDEYNDGKLIFSDGPDYEDQTGDDSELVPGDEIEVTFELENKFTTSTDINKIKVKAWLQDSDSERVTDKEETDSFDLGDGDTQDGTLTLKVPIDTEEDSLYMYVRAEGDDDNDVTHSVLYVKKLTFDKQDDDVAIDAVTISPNPAVCGQSLDILTDIWNVGNDEQKEVKLHLESSDLGIDEYSDYFDLDNNGDDREAVETMTVLLPSNIKPGNYTLVVTATYNSGKDSEAEDFGVNVVCSGYVTGAEENEGSAGTGALTVSDATLEGTQGKQVKFTATLENSGATAAAYTFELSGISDWASGYVEPDTVTLAGGASTEVFVYLTPKTSASGDETATLTVKSGGTTLESETLTVQLPEKPTLSITSLGSLGDVDTTTAALIIIGILVVVALIIAGKKKAAASAVETYGKKRGRKSSEEE